MPRATSSRATWAGSTFTFTHRKWPTSPAVEQIAQGDQGGGLARLPRRVQHEVALGPNQAQEFIDVHPVQGLDGRSGRPGAVLKKRMGRLWHLPRARWARDTGILEPGTIHGPYHRLRQAWVRRWRNFATRKCARRTETAV